MYVADVTGAVGRGAGLTSFSGKAGPQGKPCSRATVNRSGFAVPSRLSYENLKVGGH